MTLLFIEGFDLYGPSAASTEVLKKWSGLSGTGNMSVNATNSGRFGSGLSGHFNYGSNSYLMRFLGVSRTTAILGTGFRPSSSLAGNSLEVFGFLNGQTVECSIVVDGSGNITFRRGTNGSAVALGGPYTAGLTTLVWHFIELQVTDATGTGGSGTVRVDGTTIGTVSGVNTSASGNGAITGFFLGGAVSGSITSDYDDVYCLDTNGSVNNAFLGDVRVTGLLPNANGTNSQLARTGGTVSGNYTAVSEATEDGDTSYVSSLTVAQEDTYRYPSLNPSTSAVYAVQADFVARKDDAGTRSIGTRVRSGGTEATSATTVPLVATYVHQLMLMENNPVTSAAWVISDFNAAEIGPVVAA